MPKLTLQQRLVDALVATGRGTIVQSRSRKHVTLKRPDGSFFYVGNRPGAALRRDRLRQHGAPLTTSSDGCSRRRAD